MKLQRSVFVTLLALSLSGCMTFTVNSDLDKTAQATTGTDTVHRSLYGIKWSDFDEDKCKTDEGIVRLRFHTNALYLAASVVTLGVYVPQTVTWWCGKPHTDDDGEEGTCCPPARRNSDGSCQRRGG